ncbi:MAG: DJ-1/PfpI family protein [Lachnospiraceae bacterium]|nr:DJ-1/PfpI family protein [Lachnospiraceae bacterium]
MSKLGIFFAEGFEEIEALTVVDVCRRCEIEVEMVSAYGEKQVLGSHGILVAMDKTFDEADFSSYDMIVLPGGGKGTQGLEACAPLMAKVDEFYQAGKFIAAICAAPSIFGHRGFLKGRRACSYPSFESHLEGAQVTAGPVEIDGNVITSRGMGTSIDFALAIAKVFCGDEAAKDMAKRIVYQA